MPEPPALAELERQLFALIRAPEGVARGLRPAGLTRRRLEAVVLGDDRLDSVGRVGIYADMYFLRLLEVLRESFPRLLAALGDEVFAGLCTDYLDVFPSRHPSLRQLGDRLPGFVQMAGTASGRARCPAPCHCPDLPVWAADLAALDWQRYDVFDEADSELYTMNDLATLSPEGFATLPLSLIPGHRLLPVEHGVEILWRQLARRRSWAPPARAPGTLLVWRQETFVYHRRLSDREARLLRLAQSGLPFAVLCEALAGELEASGSGSSEEAEEEGAAQAALQLLARWVTDGLLAKPATGGCQGSVSGVSGLQPA